MTNGVVRRPRLASHSADHVEKMLQIHLGSYNAWMDKASILEEMGQKDAYPTWRQMADRKVGDIVELLDQAERDGVVLPAAAIPDFEAIPTRFKLREEIDRLKAAVAAAEQKLEDMKTLRASATFQRMAAEASLRRWKRVGIALGVIGVLGWIL